MNNQQNNKRAEEAKMIIQEIRNNPEMMKELRNWLSEEFNSLGVLQNPSCQETKSGESSNKDSFETDSSPDLNSTYSALDDVESFIESTMKYTKNNGFILYEDDIVKIREFIKKLKQENKSKGCGKVVNFQTDDSDRSWDETEICGEGVLCNDCVKQDLCERGKK